MATTTTTMTDNILRNRAQGHRDSTYAMLLQLMNQNDMPELLRTLETMASTRIGCWRDVRGFIRCLEESDRSASAAVPALIEGCVRMTNAHIRKGNAWAAKWVPREPKCRGSPLLQWYYDALATDMFPGAPDAKRRYRKLISTLSPPPQPPTSLTWLVKQAAALASITSFALTEEDPSKAQEINALWQQHLAKHMYKSKHMEPLIPVLSLAQSMGPGHNNCLHAGIGLALHLAALSSCNRIITFSSHAQWHALENHNDFVSNVKFLLCAAHSPTNGLNANLGSALTLSEGEPLFVISDMEHDSDPEPTIPHITYCNVSKNANNANNANNNPTNINYIRIL